MASILVLLLATITLLLQPTPESEKKQALARQSSANSTAAPEIAARLKVAANLLATDNLGKAEELLREMIGQHPYDAAPYIVLGELEMRRQAPIAAMLAYKSGIELNPDYLDKKTPLFKGKQIKQSVTESIELIDSRLLASPGDDDLQEQKKQAYYMLRKLAGSCG